MEPKTIALQYPIKLTETDIITALSIRRPTAGDIRKMKSETVDESLLLLGKLSGQPPSVIDRLDLVDIAEASKVVESFLPPGLLAGKMQ